MKTLKQFLLKEEDAVIKTSEVVKVLKDAGENTSEIKKDVDTTKPVLSYTDFIKMYANKLIEWVKDFIKTYGEVLRDERDGLEKTLGMETIKKIQQLVLNIKDNSLNLLKILDTDVNEADVRWVKNVRNYENLENKFIVLLKLEERITSFENEHFSELKKEYPNILKHREILAMHMKSVESCKNMFSRLIKIIYQYKNNNL